MLLGHLGVDVELINDNGSGSAVFEISYIDNALERFAVKYVGGDFFSAHHRGIGAVTNTADISWLKIIVKDWCKLTNRAIAAQETSIN